MALHSFRPAARHSAGGQVVGSSAHRTVSPILVMTTKGSLRQHNGLTVSVAEFRRAVRAAKWRTAMGKSPSIQDLEAKDKEFENYINGVRDSLNAQADGMDKHITDQITAWKNNATDARIIVTGRSLDFVHEASFSLEKLQGILSTISSAVFAGTEAPPGTKVDSTAQKDVEKALGPAIEQAAAIELFIAGKVFDVLGNIIYNFGSSTSVTFNSSITSEALGLGMQMFVGVGEQTYNSESFFNSETIYEYVYTYQVFYSLKQLQQETEQTIANGLANQITAFENKMSKIPLPDDPMSDQGGKYDALMAWYTKHIADAEAQLKAMGH
ncbi:MAG: hypothetical protein ABI047_01700 [Jatrophihabitantaceae bacterium]